MINTLFLPELREMLAANNVEELREFCNALHPARTAEFMEGLEPHDMWQVLQHADLPLQAENFHISIGIGRIEMLALEEEKQVAKLVTSLSADDAVDLLQKLPPKRLTPFWPSSLRRIGGHSPIAVL